MGINTADVAVLTHQLDVAPSALALYRQLIAGSDGKHVALLESAEPGSRRTQRSLVVPSAALRVVCLGADVRVEALATHGRGLLDVLAARLGDFDPQRNGDLLQLRAPAMVHGEDARDQLQQPSVLCVLRALLDALQAPSDAPRDAVFLAGAFGFELAAQFTQLPPLDDGSVFPDYMFLLADELVVIDHMAGSTQVLAMSFGADGPAQAGLQTRFGRLLAEVRDAAAQLPDELIAGHPPSALTAEADRSDAQFCADVQALRDQVARGEALQVVASRTFSMPCADAMAAYASLRALNPSPYMFHLSSRGFAGEPFVLFGASPESSIKVNASDRSVEISPIAGTRPRGVDDDMDRRHETELRLDPKENAEHMMLVDLARSDVARVAQPGSVAVADLLRVVRYSHVMHLASRVRGVLRDGLDALHACQACLNMGTLTGAPKQRAMRLLRAVERGRRGHYGGAIGYLRGDGSMDTAIIIRAALVHDGVAHVRAGAGIVHDSQPMAEADETRRKAEAALRAVSMASASEDAAGQGRIHHVG